MERVFLCLVLSWELIIPNVPLHVILKMKRGFSIRWLIERRWLALTWTKISSCCEGLYCLIFFAFKTKLRVMLNMKLKMKEPLSVVNVLKCEKSNIKIARIIINAQGKSFAVEVVYRDCKRCCFFASFNLIVSIHCSMPIFSEVGQSLAFR